MTLLIDIARVMKDLLCSKEIRGHQLLATSSGFFILAWPDVHLHSSDSQCVASALIVSVSPAWTGLQSASEDAGTAIQSCEQVDVSLLHDHRQGSSVQ